MEKLLKKSDFCGKVGLLLLLLINFNAGKSQTVEQKTLKVFVDSIVQNNHEFCLTTKKVQVPPMRSYSIIAFAYGESDSTLGRLIDKEPVFNKVNQNLKIPSEIHCCSEVKCEDIKDSLRVDFTVYKALKVGRKKFAIIKSKRKKYSPNYGKYFVFLFKDGEFIGYKSYDFHVSFKDD